MSEVRARMGLLYGRMSAIGFEVQNETLLEMLSNEVGCSSEIEGENIDCHQVRSSVARRLGIETHGLVPSSHYVDGVVEMMLDATQNYRFPLTDETAVWLAQCLVPCRKK